MASELKTSLRYANRAFNVPLPGDLTTGTALFVEFDSDGEATGVDNDLADALVAAYPHEIELVSQA